MPPRTRRTAPIIDGSSDSSTIPVDPVYPHRRHASSSRRPAHPGSYYDDPPRGYTYGRQPYPIYTPHTQTPWIHPHGEAPPVHPWAPALPATRLSDTTLFLAILAGASIGNITARPTLIIFLWLAYAFYSFLGDVQYTLAQRRYRLEQAAGPFGTQIILGVFKAFVWIGGFMMFLGLWRVLRIFW